MLIVSSFYIYITEARDLVMELVSVSLPTSTVSQFGVGDTKIDFIVQADMSLHFVRNSHQNYRYR